MTNDEQRDDATLHAADLEALHALRSDEDPGRLLEERTVRVLREHGLVAHAPRSRSRPWVWAAAAAIAFFVVGFTLGRGTATGGASMADVESRSTQRLAVDDDAAPTRVAEGPVQTVSTDSTDANGARFVVWF